MPYLEIHLTPDNLASDRQAELASGATRLLAELLGKRADLTVVRLVPTPTGQWFAAGGPLPQLGRAAHVELKITQGTNSESEKARFLAALHQLMVDTAGPLSAPTYTVIQEIPATDWGYDGVSQAARRTRP